jgi:hypothetical protein
MKSFKVSQKPTITVTLTLLFLLALVLPQVTLAAPPYCDGPNCEGMFVEVVGPEAVESNEEFEVSIVVRNATDLFGGQFELSFDPAYLQGVEGSLEPGADLAPSVVGVANIDNEAGSVSFAAARKGDVDELSGDVVLATMRFVAQPVEEATETTIGISNVLLGDKDATEIAIDGTQDLPLTINPSVTGVDVTGQVMLEGRATDNWDGAEVTATLSPDGTALSTITDEFGNFEFADVPLGTYTFEADAAGYLPAVCSGVDITESLALDSAELVAGDVNDDGVIDITDAVAIGGNIGVPSPDPATADLNEDGAVNILDLILMAINFGKESPTIWECTDP